MSKVHYICALLACVLGTMVILPSSLIDVAKRLAIIGLNKNVIQHVTMDISLKDDESLASSVWCVERQDSSKFCQFKNLYYLPQFKDCLIFLLNEHSIISGIKFAESLKQISLSAVKNHTGLDLNLVIIKSKDNLLDKTIKLFKNHSFLMKRFKPDNIMHVIHDDLLPLFVTFHELCVGDVQDCLSKYHVIFLDNNNEGPFYEWYTYFSNHKLKFLTREKSAVCIQHSVIGLSHESIWYQYGFKSTHGRFWDSRFDGLMLTRFTKFVKKAVKTENDEGFMKYRDTSADPTALVFLSRKINRKILYERTVENQIKVIYERLYNKPLQILNLDLSVNSSIELISAITKTRILIGMHGSAMIHAMFLPPGSTIIELFPFGIQPFFVSPLKALCSRPNVFYKYLAWVNKNESNTRTHPDFPPLHGGISHLPLSEQHEIVNVKTVPPVSCCHQPTYLFRMFQDTIVDDSFYRLVSDVFSHQMRADKMNYEDYETKLRDTLVQSWYFPPPVFNISCECVKNKLKMMWNFPFTISANITFSLVTDSGISMVTNQTSVTLEVKKCYKTSSTSSPLSVWIKTVEDRRESVDSYIQCV